MEVLGKFKFNHKDNGSYSVNAEFTYFGRDTDKGIIWFIPAIDSWFQTKTADQAEKVATRLMDHFLDVYLMEDNTPLRFTKKLKEIGWTNLPTPKPISKNGYRAGYKKIVDLKDFITHDPFVNRQMDGKIRSQLPIIKTNTSTLELAS